MFHERKRVLLLTIAVGLMLLVGVSPASACPTCSNPAAWGATPCLTTNCSLCGYCAYCCGRLGIGCGFCCRDCGPGGGPRAPESVATACDAPASSDARDEFEHLFGVPPVDAPQPVEGLAAH